MIHLKKEILDREKNYYVAISAGVDSLACLHFLKKLRYKVKACHFNHNLREQNKKMQEACRSFCDEFGIELAIGLRNKSESALEHELRADRLDFFGSLGESIICAHHLGDCVEQYFMNMLKGCPEHIPINYITYFHDPVFTLYHPFLRNSKKKLVNYVKSNNLNKFIVEDETNIQNKYRRNWVRNMILPQLESFNLEKVVLKKFFIHRRCENPYFSLNEKI